MTADARIRLVKLVAHVPVAVFAGLAAAAGAAMLGHAYLVQTFGEEGIPAVDDTPLMAALVGGAYLAGVVAAALVVIGGWARFLRWPR